MEIPDVLVVTKADLGLLAARTMGEVCCGPALAGLGCRLRARGVLAAAATGYRRSSLAALAEHRTGLELADQAPARAPGKRAGRLHRRVWRAGLREVGGRRAAETLLAGQDPGLDVPALVAALERSIGADDGA